MSPTESSYTIEPARPLIGDRIFTCETGLHLQGLQQNPVTYEPYPPEKVGAKRSLLYGSKCGRRAFTEKLSQLGCQLERGQINRQVASLRERAHRAGTALTDMELRAAIPVNDHPGAFRPTNPPHSIGIIAREIVFFDLVAHLPLGQTQFPGGPNLDPAMTPESRLDLGPLDILERQSSLSFLQDREWQSEAAASTPPALAPFRHAEIRTSAGRSLQGQTFFFCQDDHPFHQILHFPDIARPLVAHQKVKEFRGELDITTVALVALLQKVVEQQRDILLAITQGRQDDRHDIQAVIEISPEFPGGNCLLETDIGGGNDPDIDPESPRTAEPSRIVFPAGHAASSTGGRAASRLSRQEK